MIQLKQRIHSYTSFFKCASHSKIKVKAKQAFILIVQIFFRPSESDCNTTQAHRTYSNYLSQLFEGLLKAGNKLLYETNTNIDTF